MSSMSAFTLPQPHLSAARREAARWRMAVAGTARRGTPGASRVGKGLGQSQEYQDHAPYSPGDDLRYLDWRALARTDEPLLKRFRDEVSPWLDIVVDVGPHMIHPAFAPRGALALDMAAVLALAAKSAHATPAFVALGGENAIRLPGDPDRLLNLYSIARRPRFRAAPADDPWEQSNVRLADGRMGDGSQPLVASAGEVPTSEAGDQPPDAAAFPSDPPWRRGAQDVPLKTGSVRVLMSDLLFPQNPTPIVRRLSAHGTALFVVMMLRRSEQAPERFGPVRLTDPERPGGDALETHVGADEVIAYRARLGAHIDRWRRECAAVGATFTIVDADAPLGDAVSALAHAGLLVPVVAGRARRSGG